MFLVKCNHPPLQPNATNLLINNKRQLAMNFEKIVISISIP